MTWGFLWLMVALKVPIAALLYIVWWAVKQDPDAAEDTGDGGTRRRPERHPRRPLPRLPRRGPHGDPVPASPPRVRSVVAKARSYER